MANQQRLFSLDDLLATRNPLAYVGVCTEFNSDEVIRAITSNLVTEEAKRIVVRAAADFFS